MISYKAAVASTPGGKSTHNGDNFYFNTRYLTEDLAESQVLLSHKKNQKGLQIYAVCDGTNGDSQAEEASLLLVKNLMKYHKKLVDNPSSDVPSTISEYIDFTNEQVNKQIRELMGKRIYSTLALLCVERESTLICSVGDSRVYSYSDGVLTQITEDHTQAQRMVQLGLLTPERARTHVKREKLTQYFGEMPAGMSIDPFMETTLSKHGDTYILCTRGFYEAVPTEQMEKILARGMSPADTVDELMAYAMDNGIKEDATVIVVTAYDSNKAAVPVTASIGAAAASMEAAEEPSTQSTLFAHDEITTPSMDSKQQFEEYNENYEEPSDDIDSFIGKLLSPFRRGSKKNNNEFWPALIIFAVCILSVAVLSVFGYNLFLRNRNNELEPTKLPMATNSTVVPDETPSISGVIHTAGPGGADMIDPNATPSSGGSHHSDETDPTDRPTDEPTSEPTDEPTHVVTAAPTEAPIPTEAPTEAPTPTEEPTPTPTEEPTPTPTEESTPTEEPTPSGEEP